VAHNRARTDRTKNAGGFISGLATQLEIGHAELSAAVEAINPVIDEDFRRHCTVGVIGDGALTIHVDEPSLVAAMRVRWAGAVLEAVRQLRKFSKIRQVTFEFADDGAGFQGPGQAH
jgi:hypothetical protein